MGFYSSSLGHCFDVPSGARVQDQTIPQAVLERPGIVYHAPVRHVEHAGTPGLEGWVRKGTFCLTQLGIFICIGEAGFSSGYQHFNLLEENIIKHNPTEHRADQRASGETHT